MTMEILLTRLDARVAECQQLVTAIHPEFPSVDYALFTRRRAAGLAFGNEHRIALNEVLLRENPVANLKVLYGTGWIGVDDATGKVVRRGGIDLVIKDGIVYDARRLLRDVEEMVAAAKAGEAEAAAAIP